MRAAINATIGDPLVVAVFLLVLGTSGIIVSMIAVGTLFLRTEKQNVDCRDQVQALVGPDQQLVLMILHFLLAQELGQFL